MNTRNLHYFPVNLALMLVFSLMCALPFTSFYFFGVEKSQPVLGTKSTVVNNVTLNQQSQINLVEFSYSLLPFEEKQIGVSGTKVYLKQGYEGVQFKVVGNVLYIKNLGPHSYIVEGIVF